MLLGVALVKAILYPFLAIAALDVLLKAVRVGGGDENARWYLIHAVTNGVICVLIGPDIVVLFRSPLEGLSASYASDFPLAISVSLHLYHCVSQAHKLTAVDWAHHLGGNMLVCALAFPFRYGPLLSWGILFVCGLPGGLDYVAPHA